MELNDKVAIVTGGGSGIGAEIVRLFLEANGRVVAVDIEPALPVTMAALSARFPGRLRTLVGDVATEDTAIAFTRAALDAFGRIDVMVNNAGVACVKAIADHSPEEWDRVINVNVKPGRVRCADRSIPIIESVRTADPTRLVGLAPLDPPYHSQP